MMSSRRKSWGVALLAVLMLAVVTSCGVGEAADASGVVEDGSGNGAGAVTFAVEVTGAETLEYFGAADMRCSVGESGLLTLIFATGEDRAEFTFAADLEPGTYTVSTPDLTADAPSPSVTAFYQNNEVLPEVADYDTDIDGTLTLESIALAAGDTMSGSFSFNGANSEGAEVTVEGTYSFEVSNTMLGGCT
ncbi:MAG: DUF6252 family protein [Chloroflexota bacterium]